MCPPKQLQRIQTFPPLEIPPHVVVHRGEPGRVRRAFQGYPEIARRYRRLTRRTDKLAIDINIVERYQDVYPTRQQTGTELLGLVNAASRSFPRVALYFENSILAPDLPLLAAASAAVTRVERKGKGLVVESSYGCGGTGAGRWAAVAGHRRAAGLAAGGGAHGRAGRLRAAGADSGLQRGCETGVIGGSAGA